MVLPPAKCYYSTERLIVLSVSLRGYYQESVLFGNNPWLSAKIPNKNATKILIEMGGK